MGLAKCHQSALCLEFYWVLGGTIAKPRPLCNTTKPISYYQILGTINLVHPQKKPTFLPTLPKPNRVE